MRQVNKIFRPIPEKLLQCFQEKQLNLLAKRENHSFDSNCYNKSIKDDLKALYHNKCAFCESKLNNIPKDYYEFTVEHFRPKNLYFWLGYEWSNLMPSCNKCNGKKDNNFQVPDKRKKQNLPLKDDVEGQDVIDLDKCIANCEELLAEQADLLHPEIENPMNFLAFDNQVIGKFVEDLSQRRANYTINLCLLNRTDLFLRRKEIYDTLLTQIKEQTILLMEIYGMDYDSKALRLAFETIFNKLYKSAADESAEYVSFWRFLIENFDELFIAKMPTKEAQNILKNAFVSFIEKHT